MDNLESLTRSELLAILRGLEKTENESGLALVEHLSHELSVHREELAMQNDELRAMAADLEASRNRYASLYDFAPVGYLTLNIRGEIQELNLTAAHMLAKERVHLERRPIQLFLGSGERPRFLAFLQDAVSAGQRVSQDFTFTFQTKPELHVQFDAIPTRNDAGTLLWCSMTDISARFAAEEELRKSQANMTALIENTREAIWSVNRDYEVVISNVAFEALRGSFYPAGIERRAVSKSSTAATPAVQRWRSYYERALRAERFSVEEERSFDGQRLYYELNFNPIFARELGCGQISGVSVFATDITARKQLAEAMKIAKERAESQSKYRANVLSNLSHELRTPLNAMLSYTTLIEETAMRDDVKDYVGVIRRNGERLVHLVNHSLDLARLEAGHVPLDRRIVDPREIVEQQVRLLRPMAQEHGLYLRLGPSSSGLISVDLALFEQILTNLVGNAIKYTESGGITIEIASGQQEIELRVRDTGIGISNEFLPQIFDEFKREHHELNEHTQGAGLGLSITRKQVEIMGGSIGCFSVQGEGTTFWVRFPRAERPEQSKTSNTIQADRERRAAFHDSRLLLVEDDPDQADGIQAILSDEWHVDIARSGEAAISLADRYLYDGVLLDVGLGSGMNGFDVSRRLRKSPRFTNVPIVAMTGDPAYNREAALLSGCDAFLIKPVTTEVVSNVFEALMEH